MADTAKLIGRLITATAPRRRALRGVVLPPPPKSRSTKLRVAVDGRAPIPFNPDDWTITVIAGPHYSHGNLPAEHLATATMLKVEMRKERAPGQGAVAEYAVRDGAVHLFAVADAAPMKPLPPARAAAWTKARTCQRCNELRPRPLPASPEGDLYCDPCHQALAAERWTEQALTAQADAAQWARDVLADPHAMLIAADTWHSNIGHLRAETTTGDLLTDIRVRDTDNPFSSRYPDNWTDDQIQDHVRRYSGTIGPTRFQELATTITARHPRAILWVGGWPRVPIIGRHLPNPVPDGDDISTRLTLWAAQAPQHRTGYWYPEPRIPCNHTSAHPEYRYHSDLRKPSNRDLPEELRNLRYLLHLIALKPAPAPTIPKATAA